MMTEKTFAAVKTLDVGYYDMDTGDFDIIHEHNGDDILGMVYDAFRYGFIRGQRAEKARAAERRRRARGV